MNFLGAGMDVDEILLDYPELKKNEILAAIKYAAKLVTEVERPNRDSQVSVILHEITGR